MNENKCWLLQGNQHDEGGEIVYWEVSDGVTTQTIYLGKIILENNKPTLIAYAGLPNANDPVVECKR